MSSFGSLNLFSDYPTKVLWTFVDGKPQKVKIRIKEEGNFSVLYVGYFDSKDQLIREEPLRPNFPLSTKKSSLNEAILDYEISQVILE